MLASPKPAGKLARSVSQRKSSPLSSAKNRWQLLSSQITKKSSQSPIPLCASTVGGSLAKKFCGCDQPAGLPTSSLVEYCGWPDWKMRYHFDCGAK